MPTLANIHGASVVTDPNEAIKTYTDARALDEQRLREEQAKAEEERKKLEAEATLNERLGVIFGKKPKQRPEGVPPAGDLEGRHGEEIKRIFKINPTIGKTIQEALTRNNPEEIDAVRKDAERSSKLAEDLAKLPDHAARQKRILEEGNEVAVKGGDVGRIIDLSNKSPAELDLELTGIRIMSKDILKALPAQSIMDTADKQMAFAQISASNPKLAQTLLEAEKMRTEGAEGFTLSEGQTRFDSQGRAIASVSAGEEETFEPVYNARGQIVGQQSSLSGKVISDPRASKTTGAQTAIGKAREDLNNNLITPEEFNTIKATPNKARSKVGVLMADRKMAVAEHGENSPEAKVYDDAIKALTKGKKIRPNFQDFTSTDGVSSTLDINSPEGVRLANQIVANGGRKGRPKEVPAAQSKAAGFAVRVQSAGEIIDKIGSKFATVGSQIGSLAPNAMKSDDRQKFEQAERNFINAQLRRESGAAIAESEFVNARQQYIPQAGDSEAVLLQKAENRADVFAALKAEGGRAFQSLPSRPKKIMFMGEVKNVGDEVTAPNGNRGTLLEDGSIFIK